MENTNSFEQTQTEREEVRNEIRNEVEAMKVDAKDCQVLGTAGLAFSSILGVGMREQIFAQTYQTVENIYNSINGEAIQTPFPYELVSTIGLLGASAYLVGIGITKAKKARSLEKKLKL